MGTISITLPTIGDLNATEDVDVRNALSTIQTAINGNIDQGNMGAAVKPSGSAAAGTEALRALGTAAGNAAAGNDGRFVNAVTSAFSPGPGTALYVAAPVIAVTSGWGTYNANYGTTFTAVSGVWAAFTPAGGASITSWELTSMGVSSCQLAINSVTTQNVTARLLIIGT